jgi:RNA polymerase sigma-70 factor (ECF subfamily)
MVGTAAEDETELIRRSIGGDQLAFAQIVARYRVFVTSLAYRLCGDPAAADDIAQEVFVHVWQALPRFRGDAAFRTWLYRIASNASIEYLRRLRPTQSLDEGDCGEQVASSGSNTWPRGGRMADLAASDLDAPESHVLRDEQRLAVQSAVLKLPMQARAALVLREYHNLSYKEIAVTLGIPIGTVMSRLNYARQWLRQELARQSPEELC